MSYSIEENFQNIEETLNKLTNYSEQDIIKYTVIFKAIEKSYGEVNKWIELEDAIVVFSELKNSTKISIEKQKRTTTKILEYLNYPFIEIHGEFGTEFIDIKVMVA